MTFLHVLLFISMTGFAASQNCGFYRTSVGSFNITVLSDGTDVFDSQMFFPEVNPAAFSQAAKRHFKNEVVLHYNCIYLDTGAHKVLVETGNGLGSLGEGQGRLLENMKAAGLDPKEIDTVIISHAHPDHIGGVVKPDGSMVFPNAKYFMGGHEVDFWEAVTVETSEVKSLILPPSFKELVVGSAKSGIGAIKSDLTPVEFEEEIVPGVIVKSMVGETPGQIGLLIRSGGDSIMYTADALVSDAFGIERPEWNTVFEMEKSVAIANRFKLLKRLQKGKIRVFMYHLPFPGIGRIIKTSSGYGYRAVPYEF